MWLLCWIQSLEICWELLSGDAKVSCRHSQCLSMARHWETTSHGDVPEMHLWNLKPISFNKNQMRVYSAPRSVFNEGYGDIVLAINEFRVLWQRQICKLITAGDITGDESGGYILRDRRGIEKVINNQRRKKHLICILKGKSESDRSEKVKEARMKE